MNAVQAIVCKLNRYWGPMLLLVLLVVVIMRAPDLFTNPRFWAEEGRDSFAVSWSEPWHVALLHPHKGFLYLTMNLATLVAARAIPIEVAPLVTTIVALAVQLGVFWYILFGLAERLNIMQRSLLCLISLFVVNTGETWLTTTTVQFQLTVLTFMILLADHSFDQRGWFATDISILWVAGLTGPVSNLLLPIFVIQWWRTRKKGQLIRVVSLSFTSLVQLFYMLSFTEATHNRLAMGSSPSRVIEAWVRQFLLWPVFGESFIGILDSHLLQGVFAAIVGIAAGWVAFSGKQWTPRLVFLAFLTLSWGSLIGSAAMRGGWRYAYAPAVVLLSVFVLASSRESRRPVRWLSGVIVAVSLLVWMSQYRTRLPPWVDPERPVWATEIAAWRQDPSHQIKISPQWEGRSWTIRLEAQREDKLPRP